MAGMMLKSRPPSCSGRRRNTFKYGSVTVKMGCRKGTLYVCGTQLKKMRTVMRKLYLPNGAVWAEVSDDASKAPQTPTSTYAPRKLIPPSMKTVSSGPLRQRTQRQQRHTHETPDSHVRCARTSTDDRALEDNACALQCVADAQTAPKDPN
eukprot:scaffold3319_cov258-Pinguiococcus_pyrenoidosus.AAC.21